MLIICSQSLLFFFKTSSSSYGLLLKFNLAFEIYVNWVDHEVEQQGQRGGALNVICRALGGHMSPDRCPRTLATDPGPIRHFLHQCTNQYPTLPHQEGF